MSARLIFTALLISVVVTPGCGTPYHDEMRTDAQRRLGVMNALLGYDQALQFFNTAQFDKALEQIENAIRQDPEPADYHLLEARIFIETNKLESAIASLETAIEKDSESADPHYYSGIVYQRWSNDESAYEEYLTASELESSSVFYLLAAAESLVALERFGEARDLIEPRLDYFEHNSAMRHLLGQIAMLEGHPQLAADYLEEAYLMNPEDGLLLEELAHVQYAAEQFSKSLKSIRQLRDLTHSNRHDLMQFEADCLSRMERVKEAYGIYQDLSSRRSSDVQVWVNFGALAWELEDYHRVAFCGARLSSLAPERFEGYFFKGINEQHHGNLSEAIELLRDAAVRCDDSAMPYLALGRALEDSGDFAAARNAYNAAKAVDPADDTSDLLLAALTKKDELVTVPTPDDSR